MATLPPYDFYGTMMRREEAFRKQTQVPQPSAHAKMRERGAGLPVGVATTSGPISWHYRQKINAMVYQAIAT